MDPAPLEYEKSMLLKVFKILFIHINLGMFVGKLALILIMRILANIFPPKWQKLYP